MITDVVIMAGGIGERLWPASTPEHPKQFFRLNDDLSFFQSSLLRALALDVNGKIIIVTRRELVNECARQCVDLYLKLENDSVKEKLLAQTVVLGELCARHTLAALMTGLAWINGSRKVPGAPEKRTVLAITCDHVMENSVAFLSDCEYASLHAEKGRYVLFGIRPASPSTNYGYIRAVDELEPKSHGFRVERFLQKPDRETAEKLLEEGGYFWNSGMLCFDLDCFFGLVKKNAPATWNIYEEIMKASLPDTRTVTDVFVMDSWPELDRVYCELPLLDVDREISQKADNAAMMEAHFSWTDIGSWDTLFGKCSLKQTSPVVSVEGENNLVYSDIPVVLCGIDDLIVIQKEGKLLVLKKGRSDLIKGAVEKLREEHGADDSRR